MTGPLPSRVPCQNRRHSHDLAHGARCFPLVPQDRPLAHRAVGTVAILALSAAGVAVCAPIAAAEWLVAEGQVRLAVVRAKWKW